MRSPRREAISRRRTLWSFEPVKYCSAAPKDSGSTTRRSIDNPSWWRTEALVGPWAMTSTTEGSDVSVRITRAGSVDVTSRSTSLTVSRMRRSEPAISSRSTPPCARSASPTWTAIARAAGSSPRARPAFQSAMPLRMFSHVFSRMPATPMISFDRHSASSRSMESTPRCSHSARAVRGPRPRISSSVRNAGGSSARRASSRSRRPVARYSSMRAARSRPIPGRAVSPPRAATAATSSPSVSSVWAPRWYARMRNTDSLRASSRLAIS